MFSIEFDCESPCEMNAMSKMHLAGSWHITSLKVSCQMFRLVFRLVLDKCGVRSKVLHKVWSLSPLLFLISALGSFTSVTQRKGPTTLLLIWRQSTMNTECHDRDSNPHSTFQKQQGPFSWLCLPPNSAVRITILRLRASAKFLRYLSKCRMPSNQEYASTEAKTLLSV